MSSVVKSISDIVTSVFELFGSIIQTVFNIFRGAFQAVFNFFSGIITMVLDFLRGTINAAGGLGKFVVGKWTRVANWTRRGLLTMKTGNFFVLAAIALAIFGYLQYQRQQGRTVKVGDKKLN